MTKLLRASIHHPFIVIFFTLLLALGGLYSFFHLPIDAVPDITNNQVQINVMLEGFSPEQMEKQVTRPIEIALAGIPRLESTRSLSRSGFAQVTAIFEDQADLYFSRQQINERLSELKEHLPPGTEINMGPIATGLSEVYMWTVDFKSVPPVAGKPGPQPDGSFLTPEGERLRNDEERLSYLRTVEDFIIRPQLMGIPGLAGVDAIGGYSHQVQIAPSLHHLIEHGITIDQLAEALKKSNKMSGPGIIERQGEGIVAVADARWNTPEEIEQLMIVLPNHAPIRLGEIAQVMIGKETRSGSATANGKEVVTGTALMLIGANSRTVAKSVEEKLLQVNQTLPVGIEATPVLNRSRLVDATIHTVTFNLLEGATLVVAVLLLMLGHLKAALIVALVIPLSMLLTAIGMVETRLSGNLMSLGAIDFGLIVDGAVITTENALRRLSQKALQFGRMLTQEEKREELLEAVQEMIKPSLFGQAIIILVYVPMLTLSGVEGKMFHPMALTVILALLSALLLSVTFIPAMISWLIEGKPHEGENRLNAWLKKLYAPVLDGAIRWPVFSATLSALFVASTLFLSAELGQEFIPSLDEQDIALQAARIPSVSLPQSTAMQMKVEKALKELPEVEVVFSKTGTAEMASDPMPPNLSDTFVILKPRHTWPDPTLTKDALIERMEERLSLVPGTQFEFTQPIELRFNELIAGVKSDVAVKVYGDDFAKMQKTAEAIAAVLTPIPGAADVKVGQTEGLPLLNITFDKTRLSQVGLSADEALTLVDQTLGTTHAGTLYAGDRHYDLVVRLTEADRNNTDLLGRLPLQNILPLSEVAHIQFSEGLNEIRRENGKRFVAVEANVRERDLGSFIDEAKRNIATSVDIPRGYWITFGGQFENLLKAKERLLLVVPLTLSLIYLLLYMALGSKLDALLVFSGVPFALTGGILALWLRDMPFSITAAVGFIALSGIAVLNGLVMVTAIREQPLPLHEAIRSGALQRLRPVLMTALVASLGFIPMALATGVGAEVQKPLATVVIGGLLTSTLLTLLVLPSLFQLIGERSNKE